MTEPTMMQTVQTIVADLKDKKGALLPILHAVQNALGYVCLLYTSDAADE